MKPITTVYGSTIEVSPLDRRYEEGVKLRVLNDTGVSLATKHLSRGSAHELIRQLVAIVGEPPVESNWSRFQVLRVGELFHFSDAPRGAYAKTGETSYMDLRSGWIENSASEKTSHMQSSVSYTLIPGITAEAKAAL